MSPSKVQSAPDPSSSPASTFLDILRVRAEHDPHATAIRSGAAHLSYADLLMRVDSAARALQDAGVTHGDRVALVAENSPEHLVAAFAVWRAGAVLVTVYPSSGQTDLGYCLASARPRAVLADARRLDPVREATGNAVPVLHVGDLPSVLPLGGAPETPAVADPDSVALICYTSGSTARPKAVMHSHRGLADAAGAYAEVWHLDSRDRTVVSLPMAWAFGLVTLSMATLSVGGTVLPLARSKPELLVHAVETDGATFLAGVTTIFVKLVEHLRGRPGSPVLSSLRLCISGGEPRNERVFREWEALTGVPVHDVYAASECFPAITYDPVREPVPVHGSAGRVAPRARLRIVDPLGQDVATGMVGEALIQGPATFLGYWEDEEQTRSVLTPDGWYRTQDLARIDDEGHVFIEGRLSNVIIHGGSNVSPMEVEEVLRSHPDIRDAAVVGLPDEVYGQSVVAAVVAVAGTDVDVAHVVAWCRTRLAAYKVPELHLVGDLPVNGATGKLDRRQVAVLLSTDPKD